MSKPEYLDQLIDQASEAAGNDSQLAKMLDVTRQAVSDWRKNRKPCPPADQALMASIAGLKPEEWAARALIAQYEGTSKGDKLYRVLGKAFPAIGAALVSSGANAQAICSTAVTDFIRCILLLTTTKPRTA